MVHLQKAQGLSSGDADVAVTARDAIEDEPPQGEKFIGQHHLLGRHLHGAQPFVQLVSYNLKGRSIAGSWIIDAMIGGKMTIRDGV